MFDMEKWVTQWCWFFPSHRWSLSTFFPELTALWGQRGVHEIFAQLKLMRLVISNYAVQWCPEPIWIMAQITE